MHNKVWDFQQIPTQTEQNSNLLEGPNLRNTWYIPLLIHRWDECMTKLATFNKNKHKQDGKCDNLMVQSGICLNQWDIRRRCSLVGRWMYNKCRSFQRIQTKQDGLPTAWPGRSSNITKHLMNSFLRSNQCLHPESHHSSLTCSCWRLSAHSNRQNEKKTPLHCDLNHPASKHQNLNDQQESTARVL